MKPDFIDADMLLDNISTDNLALVALVSASEISVELLSNLDKLDDVSMKLYVVLVDNAETAKTLQVVKLPQIRFFKQGTEIKSHIGLLDLDSLLDMIESVQSEHG